MKWCHVLIGCLAALVNAQECFFWQIKAGDSLVYNVDAYDTVAIGALTTLYRHRQEQWRIVCDSTRGDTLFIRQALVRYSAREHNSRGDSSVRQTSQWTSKTARLVLTRRGWRLQSSSPENSTVAALPGSVFGITFFVPLDSVCARCGTEWLIESCDTLVEYAWPAPLTRRMYLCSFDTCDALGKPLRLSFAETTDGIHRVTLSQRVMQTAAWLLAHGVVEIHRELAVPATIWYTQQVRLRIEHSPGYREQTGELRSSVHAVLVESGIRRGK